jgi:hypothetical protein
VPNNDLVGGTTFSDGQGFVYNDANSASAINWNPTLADGGRSLQIFYNADNGTQDTNDFFGYPNGLSYIGGGRTEFVVGKDTTASGTEALMSYGYDDNAGSTVADTTMFIDRRSDNSLRSATASNTGSISTPSIIECVYYCVEI